MDFKKMIEETTLIGEMPKEVYAQAIMSLIGAGVYVPKGMLDEYNYYVLREIEDKR